ncbi:hypothetical protein BDZ94DRAFT_1265263 [Collybia nuda]|uniref:Uncharacterized protein n=1 Tax=Collybia nuda TaxID=64659 RepID=A0A9P5Y1Y9_9AGAR|nr:hypothetical protein BDZ94DRAFT_1265263 [Collybia nuda]
MYLQRATERRETDVCPPGRFCAPSLAIVGSDPFGSEKDGEPSGGPDDFEKPGPHRYIGVGMVAGMVFMVLVLYLVLGKRPRRFARAHFPCCSHLEVAAPAESKDVAMIEVEVDAKPRDSLHRPRKARKLKTPTTSQSQGMESSRTRVPQMRGYKVGVDFEYVVNWEYQHAHKSPKCDEAKLPCNDIQHPEPLYAPPRQNQRSSSAYAK